MWNERMDGGILFAIYLPIIRKVIFNHWASLLYMSVMAMHKQATPAQMNVADRIHFLPTFMMMKMARPMAGISTRPAKAYSNNKNVDNFLNEQNP